jgi:hypothetical protein
MGIYGCFLTADFYDFADARLTPAERQMDKNGAFKNEKLVIASGSVAIANFARLLFSVCLLRSSQ